MKALDLAGSRSGRLLVLFPAKERVSGNVAWVCLCDCGQMKTIAGTVLKKHIVRSCGCLRREMLTEKNTTHGGAVGLKKGRLYRIWKGMRLRCSTPHPRYGGRGISVCAQWEDFAVFRAWAFENGYNESLSIDRIDNDGDYEPVNCRWANRVTQSRNMSRNVSVVFHGVKMTLGEAVSKVGLRSSTVRRRVKAGMSLEQALTDAPRKGKPLRSRVVCHEGQPSSSRSTARV